MKKITNKKKLLLGLGSTLALSSTLAIVSQTLPSFDFNNTNISSDVLPRENNIITNEGYNIGNDGFVELGSKNINDYNIEALTPNVFKGIPNGYVFPIKNENNLKLISIDKNNLTKILWTITFNEVANTEILSVEYLPFQDTIIVMYIESDNGLKVNESGYKWIQVKKIKNISNYIDGSDLTTQATKKTIFDYYYDGSDNFASYTRADTFGMSPIFEINGPTKELVFYPRVINQPSKNENQQFNWFKIYNIDTNEIQTHNISYSISNQLQAITSMGAFKYSDGVYGFNILMARFVPKKGTFFQQELINSSNSLNISKYQSFDEKKHDSTVLGRIHQLDIGSISKNIKTLPMVPGVSMSLDGKSISFSFLENVFSYNYNLKKMPIISSSHRSSKIMFTSVDLENKSIKENKTWKYMFLSNDGASPSWFYTSEVWSGYFDNAPVLKSGLNITKGIGTPLIGLAYKQDNGIYGFYSFVIKDSTNSEANGYGNTWTSAYLNEHNIRIYLLSKNSNVSNTNMYNIYPYLTLNNEDNLSYYAFLPGVNVLEYDDSFEKINNPFTYDILYTNNGGGVVI